MKDHEAEVRELAAELEPTLHNAMTEMYKRGVVDGHTGVDSRLDILRVNHYNPRMSDKDFRKIVGDVLEIIDKRPIR